ncbi:hypothetical protein ACSSS7_002243 [Eimeria intestinalis]
MEGPLGPPGLLGALEETADVQRAKELLITADLIAADAGASGCLVSRWGPLLLSRARGRGPPTGGPLGGPPIVPRICQLEGFKELQRRQRRRQLRSPQPQHKQQQHQHQHQQQQQQQQEKEEEDLGVPEAETAIIFVSSFLDKALPSVEALVDLLPRLKTLTLCCFYSVSAMTSSLFAALGPPSQPSCFGGPLNLLFSRALPPIHTCGPLLWVCARQEDQQRWHSLCMHQQQTVSLQRVVALLRQRREGGPQSRSRAPGGPPLPLSIETLHTPLHASPFSANSFLLTGGRGAPPPHQRGPPPQGEEGHLIRGGAPSSDGAPHTQLGLLYLSLPRTLRGGFYRRRQRKSDCYNGAQQGEERLPQKAMMSDLRTCLLKTSHSNIGQVPAVLFDAVLLLLVLLLLLLLLLPLLSWGCRCCCWCWGVAAVTAAVVVEAYSALASRLAECCFWWGCSSAAVHCSGAAARMLGRAVAERIPPKSRRSGAAAAAAVAAAAAAAAAGVRGTSAEAAAQNQEVLLLIVDRLQQQQQQEQQHTPAGQQQQQRGLQLLDLQSPLASGGLVSPLTPPDRGVAMMQQLTQQRQQQQPQQKQGSSVPYPAGCRGLGVIGDFPRLSFLVSSAEGGVPLVAVAPKPDSTTEEAAAALDAARKVTDHEQQQQQQQQQQRGLQHGAACSAQRYLESGRLHSFCTWGPQAHRELFLAAASVGPDPSSWQRVAAALSSAFEVHGITDVDPPRAFDEGSSSSVQQRRGALLLLLLRLLQRTREQDSSWGRRFSALRDRLALWPLLEFLEELLLPCLLAGDPIENLQRQADRGLLPGGGGLEALRAALLLAAARASATVSCSNIAGIRPRRCMSHARSLCLMLICSFAAAAAATTPAAPATPAAAPPTAAVAAAGADTAATAVSVAASLPLGPDGSPASRQCMRRSGKCCCWECLLDQLSRTSSSSSSSSRSISSSSKVSAVAARLWSIQQARGALSANRSLPSPACSGLPDLQREMGKTPQRGHPQAEEGGGPWLLQLARGLRATPGEASAYSDAPPANAPLLGGILKQGMSSSSDNRSSRKTDQLKQQQQQQQQQPPTGEASCRMQLAMVKHSDCKPKHALSSCVFACRTVSFLWGVAKSGAEAVAGRDRLSLKSPQLEKKAPKRLVVVFVLGGVALQELEAFGAFRGGPDEPAGAPLETDFLVGSTALTSPGCLASQLFDDLITEPQAI